jgi:hypothetical protein
MTAGRVRGRRLFNPLRRGRRLAHPCPVFRLAVILDTALACAAMTAASDLLRI